MSNENQYKIGQKVRVTNPASRYYGKSGYIEDVSYKVRFDNDYGYSAFIGDSLECVESTKEPMKVDPSFADLAADLADKWVRVNIVPANELRRMLGLEEKKNERK